MPIRESQRSTERWHPRSVYGLLLWLFRPRPGSKPLEPPFLTNRPLTESEYRGARYEYVVRQRSQIVRRAGEKPDKRYTAEVSAYMDQALTAGDWDSYRVIGSAAFASKPERQKLRRRLLQEKAFSSGPVVRRRLLAKAWRALPQAKKAESVNEARRKMIGRREREFAVAFLWGEARALAASRGSAAFTACVAQADELAQRYAYIGMSAPQIREAFESKGRKT